jgi:hypothetical protein
MKRVGFLESCSTYDCGSVHGYFCVRCRHYVATCRCTPGWCDCRTTDGKVDDSGWAGTGERSMVRERVEALRRKREGLSV